MDVIRLLNKEEGWSSVPYYCSEGYPTVATGIRIGPKGAPLSQYQFKVSKAVGAVWLSEEVQSKLADMQKHPNIVAALAACNDARQGVLISMAFQMGADGLSAFVNTLKFIANKQWKEAHDGMLNSKWAKQTPERAKRHANQILSGEWDKYYN